MKKQYFLLLGAVALAACGGGGKKGNPDTGNPGDQGNQQMITSSDQLFTASVKAALEGNGLEAYAYRGDADVSTIKLNGSNVEIQDIVSNANYAYLDEAPGAGWSAMGAGSCGGREDCYVCETASGCLLKTTKIGIGNFNTDGRAESVKRMMNFNAFANEMGATKEQLEYALEEIGAKGADTFYFSKIVQFGGKPVGLEFSEFGYWGDKITALKGSEALAAIYPNQVSTFVAGDPDYLQHADVSGMTFQGNALGALYSSDAENIEFYNGTATLNIGAGNERNFAANFGAAGNVVCDDCDFESTFSFGGKEFEVWNFFTDFYGRDVDSISEAVGMLNSDDSAGNALDIAFGVKKQ